MFAAYVNTTLDIRISIIFNPGRARKRSVGIEGSRWNLKRLSGIQRSSAELYTPKWNLVDIKSVLRLRHRRLESFSFPFFLSIHITLHHDQHNPSPAIIFILVMTPFRSPSLVTHISPLQGTIWGGGRVANGEGRKIENLGKGPTFQPKIGIFYDFAAPPIS